MNAVRTHWSHGNECDLAADIGTRIASSVSWTDEVGRGDTSVLETHTQSQGFISVEEAHVLEVNQMKYLNWCYISMFLLCKRIFVCSLEVLILAVLNLRVLLPELVN
jgi:hypothetical protein